MIIEEEHNSSVSAMIFYGISIKNTASLTLNKHNINLTVYPASIWAVKNFFGGSSSINLHSIKTMLSD